MPSKSAADGNGRFWLLSFHDLGKSSSYLAVRQKRGFSIAYLNSVAALFIVFLRAYVQYRQHGRPTIDIVDTMVLQQILCGYSLMSATTPCLKGFLAGFRTGDLTRLSDENTTYGMSHGQTSGRRTRQQSYALETLKSEHQEESPQADESAGLAHRPPEVFSSASAYAEPSGENGDGSVNSFGSEQMIIHRKVEFGVTSS